MRGNLFSFLLPWERVLDQLFEKIEDGDLTEWPLAPDVARHVVRVSFVRGPESLLSKFKELHIRSRVVKQLAHIYIESHVHDLADRPGVLKIHTYERCASISESLKQHADRRVDRFSPTADHANDIGVILLGLSDVVAEQRKDAAASSARPTSANDLADSVFDMKQATMHDSVQSPQQLFEHVRPSIVTDEATSADTYTDEVILEQGLENVADMKVPMSNEFQEQFVSKYMPRIFPWALNYDCGGAEYPALFEKWDDMLADQDEMLARGIKQRWRKLAGEAALVPGEYAQMLATRPEMQVAGDWMLVPAARNLHWRYEVLHSAFLTCKQKVAPGESLQQNLDELLVAVRKIWERIAKNTVTINEKNKNINGNIGMLFSADGITAAEKLVLRSYLNTTANIAGRQAIRRKIGHCFFGFRVVHGETIFVTASPNRRHSSMILKMSRARRNDTCLERDDPVTRARREFCGKDDPKIFASSSFLDDPKGETATQEIPLPDLWARQACNAQDPISSCHHFLFFMRVILPNIFGIRMCFACPHCNCDATDYDYDGSWHACSDYLGCNSKLMGDYAGMATGMAFAVEYQGEATPHAHGFVSLANMYQHHTLEEVGHILEKNAQGISPEAMLERLSRFCEHLQKEDHFHPQHHKDNLDNLEEQFHANNAGPPENIYLSVRPSFLIDKAEVPSLWQSQGTTPRFLRAVEKEAAEFKERFETDVQFIFSRVQHHWHTRDAKGNRVPLKYCRLKGKKRQHVCNINFPRKVRRHSDGKLKK